MTTTAARLRAVAPLLVAVVLTVLAYSTGLHGGKLLDDEVNLAPLRAFSAGELTWQGVVFGNGSGLLGRSVAMLTFVLNSLTTGDSLLPFKATNLALHVVCGLLIFVLMRMLLRRDPDSGAARATLIAATLAAVWLALPIHVSTVLYIVQRMTQLSALFTLLALIAFVAGRERLAARAPGAASLLFVFVPALTIAATLSKENGVLVPAFALVIELAWYRFGTAGSRERRVAAAWFAVFLAAPAMVVLALLARHWDTLVLDDYALRDFTLRERLWTQPRILWDYVRLIVLPQGPRMGLIHDNVTIGRGLFTPATTGLALLGWLAMVALAAWAARRRLALVFAGIAWFLVGHLVESTVFALELYFEHRNYLPSLGLLMALAGALLAVERRLRPVMPALVAMLPVLIGATGLLYFVATAARAAIWSNSNVVYEQALAMNPDSPRLLQTFATQHALNGDLATTAEFTGRLRALRPQDSAADMIELVGYCRRNEAPPAALLDGARDRDARISNFEISALSLLAPRVEEGACPALPTAALEVIVGDWLRGNRLAPGRVNSWKTWFWQARLLASLGRFEAAAESANRAWTDSGDQVSVGILAFQLEARLGRIDRCAEILRRLEAADRGHNLKVAAALVQFRKWVDEQQSRRDPAA